jgi:hypothetical protein
VWLGSEFARADTYELIYLARKAYLTYGLVNGWVDLSVLSGVAHAGVDDSLCENFVLWRSSQGKPIEARLANDHIKYLHGDRLVSNTKRAETASRRGGGRGKSGGVAIGTVYVGE